MAPERGGFRVGSNPPRPFFDVIKAGNRELGEGKGCLGGTATWIRLGFGP